MSNPVAGAAARAIAAASRIRHARRRVPPAVRFGEVPDRAAQIFYLSPGTPTPRGGVRVLYRHVDLLNESGFSAAVVHHKAARGSVWFEAKTPVLAGSDVVVDPRDALVVPEYYGGMLRRIPRGQKVVLFNQGPYYTFDGMGRDDVAALAEATDWSLLTVSEDARELLGFTFAPRAVELARPVVDGAVFRPSDVPAGRRIAYMTNRRAQERKQLLGILAARGRLAQWEFVAIEGMDEQQVADTLRTSAIFLSFSDRDGFGLPPAEAMACGCFVIGHDGGGGREFFDESYSRRIESGDLLGFARAIEAAALSYEARPSQLREAGLRASEMVLSRYTAEGLCADLRTFYSQLLSH
jgi:glycosyltransferase involved in cell wall biosynthesis